MLKISCDRHRAREDNRRQALHWAIRLVEASLLAHPSPEWEELKERQAAFAAELGLGVRVDVAGASDEGAGLAPGVPPSAAGQSGMQAEL